jgi:hypothetical protein
MAYEQKPDKAMAGMLKRKSVWPPASTGEVCPDAATLAAYFDRSITPSEISHWETHFSTCSRCQEQLATLTRSEPASMTKPSEEEKPAFSWLWDWRWMAPVGAAVVILVFFVSYQTMLAPTAPKRGGELMAKRETATPAPAVSEPQKSAAPATGKTGGAADAVAGTKSLSVPRQEKTRNESDELQRKNAATALESARAAQTLKDKGARSAEGASGSVADRAMPKPADEEKQVAAAESRAEVARGLPPRPIVAQPQVPAVSAAVQAETAKTQDRIAEANRAQAAPAPPQTGVSGVRNIQKLDRAVAAVDAKEPAAQAPPELQAKDQAAARKDSAVGRQDAARARLALETAPKSKLNLFAAQGEFMVAAPNSKVLWRFGPAGRFERSRDAGKTWETQKSSVQESFLSGSAPSESICWVGGSNGVLLRTTDGGENWERIPLPTKGNIISVKASDQFNVTVTAADGRTYETRDAGTHWRAR